MINVTFVRIKFRLTHIIESLLQRSLLDSLLPLFGDVELRVVALGIIAQLHCIVLSFSSMYCSVFSFTRRELLPF